MIAWRHFQRRPDVGDLLVCFARYALLCRDAKDPRWDELVLRLVAATLLPAPDVIQRIEELAK